MKSAGVFVGGLTSILTMNLMLIGVCSSAPVPVAPALPPPPTAAPIIRSVPVIVEPQSEPMPWGMFIWGCGGRISVDPEGVLPLPICLNRGR